MTGLTGSGLPLPHEATAVTGRMSKGAGAPGALPDVLGLAIRIPQGEGLDGPWDLVLSSSGENSLTRMLPLIARQWTAAHYGSIMSYRHHSQLRWLRATALPGQQPIPSSLRELADVLRERPLEFTVQASTPGDGWQDIARLLVRTPLAPQDHVSFDPMENCPPDLRMAPLVLSRIRERAYAGSRLGRRTPAGPQ